MDLSNSKKIVIVGAGQAAAQAIQSLRRGGYEHGIALIGDEPALPYQRPPLSKAYMKGEFDEERLFFKPDNWYDENGIRVTLSTRVKRINRTEQKVELESGPRLDYDALILATGSHPVKLPIEGAKLKNVFDLRGLSDVDRIRPNLVEDRRIVIIGAGYIGLEAAAVARQMGLDVTVVEMADRILARVTSPVISAFYEAQHRAQGVNILTNASASKLNGADGAVSSVTLTDGTEIPADLVLVGIGVRPNHYLAKAAGIACDDGILVDRDARTSDPRIFAAGDCAKRPLVHYGRNGRLESVHNAIEQGKLAAAAILGQDRPLEDCPWFWSDQYDLKLQIAGLSQDYDEIVVRGEPESRKFAAFYLKNGHLISVDAINSAPEFLASKKMIINGAKVAPATLRDTSISMKDIAAAAAV